MFEYSFSSYLFWINILQKEEKFELMILTYCELCHKIY